MPKARTGLKTGKCERGTYKLEIEAYLRVNYEGENDAKEMSTKVTILDDDASDGFVHYVGVISLEKTSHGGGCEIKHLFRNDLTNGISVDYFHKHFVPELLG